jgi:pectate lyase
MSPLSFWQRSALLPLLAFASSCVHAEQAIGKPDGFAAGTTGGGNAAAVHPTSLQQLKTALCDNVNGDICQDHTPRVIVLDHSFDFTGSLLVNGAPSTTTAGCLASSCPSGKVGQLGLNRSNYCVGRPAAKVTYDNAGREPLLVGSNKTVLGVGRNGVIKGTGLLISGGNSNVIIQNISITDINPEVVWGGDALMLTNASKVWIDHNYFARIGRQMIATGFGEVNGVTISNNEFDGRTPYSSSCDGHHYWLWLFVGSHDTTTVARNFVHDTSGRGPHAGGLNNAIVRTHIVNNYFKDLSDEGASMPLTSSASLLLEGNYYDHVTLPVYRYPNSPGPGYAFAPFVGMANPRNDLCVKYLGRACVGNAQTASGTSYQPLDEAAVSSLGQMRASLISPQSAASVAASVPGHAGVGIIH